MDQSRMKVYHQFISDGHNVTEKPMPEPAAVRQVRRLQEMIKDFDRKKRSGYREKSIPRS